MNPGSSSTVPFIASVNGPYTNTDNSLEKQHVCNDQELEQSEPKFRPQNQNWEKIKLQIVKYKENIWSTE